MVTQHSLHSHEPGEPDSVPIERHCDVAIVGGSAAGLAAALQLGRQRRSVIVVDSGEPRNAPASHMHSYLGYEGAAPGDLALKAAEEVHSYGVEVLGDRVVEVTRAGDSFRVDLASGHSLIARRVLAATGLVDRLPDIEGLAERWGRSVIHCPFCHGFEFRDKPIVQIVTSPMGLHPASLFRQLTDRLTLVLHDGVDAADPPLGQLRSNGVTVVDTKVVRVVDGRVHELAVELEDGGLIEADAVVVGPRFEVRAEPFAALGLNPQEHPSGLGDYVETDLMGETSVPGLYAAGNVTDPSQQVLQAAANGSRVGGAISFSLAEEDLKNSMPVSTSQVDWDHRYSGQQMWSGRPNGSLVDEVKHMLPGRVLDVGAGEGGDAVWLAQQGWSVTVTDISQQALDRAEQAAELMDVELALLRADANGPEPFGQAGFDLVSAHYLPLPRTPDARGVHNLMSVVAEGGTLLVVSHDPEPMRAAISEREHHYPFDPDAYLLPEDFAAVLAETDGWEIEVHDKRPRKGEHSSAHVDDVVVRARRIRDDTAS